MPPPHSSGREERERKERRKGEREGEGERDRKKVKVEEEEEEERRMDGRKEEKNRSIDFGANRLGFKLQLYHFLAL